MNKTGNILKRIILGFIIFTFLAVIFKLYILIKASNTSFIEEEKHLYIGKHTSFDELCQSLKPLLKSLEDFKLLAYYKKYPPRIKSGHFVIKKGMSNNDLINNLISGNIPISITFNNKHSIEKLSGILGKLLEPDSASLIKIFTDRKFLKANGFTRENILVMYIPNTYSVYWNITGKEFRNKMYQEYQKFWNSLRLKKAKSIGLTPIEVSILASIVQQETSKNIEKPDIAGVYINRLKNNWKLEANPTLVWYLREYRGQKNIQRLLYKDLQINTLYNTYRYKGLPPGPICMPDVSSIDAVLNYKSHNYFYFVLDPEEGRHKFSRNLKTHNTYKAKYSKWLKDNHIFR